MGNSTESQNESQNLAKSPNPSSNCIDFSLNSNRKEAHEVNGHNPKMLNA